MDIKINAVPGIIKKVFYSEGPIQYRQMRLAGVAKPPPPAVLPIPSFY
jgi:hypothetical protein